MSDFDIESQARDAINNPDNYTTLGPNEWPIGTILPVYSPHKIQLSPGWCICAGQVITDPTSPFMNLPVPSFADERFPMGTILNSSYGKTGGTNALASSGNHSHRYSIQKSSPQPSPAGYQGQGDRCYVSTLDTSSTGDHNHGGDNRPNWFGVLYIIKYK